MIRTLRKNLLLVKAQALADFGIRARNKWKIGLQNVKDAFINLVEEAISILFTCPQFDGLVRA